MKDLKSLPPGSAVGIENFNPRQVKRLTKRIDGRKFVLQKGDNFYWDQIIQACDSFGLQVAYLDDFATYREYVVKFFEQRDGETTLSKCCHETKLVSETDLQKIRESIFRAQVEAQYIQEVKREEDILGTADFEGEINDGYVQFLKTYIDEKSSYAAYKRDSHFI